MNGSLKVLTQLIFCCSLLTTQAYGQYQSRYRSNRDENVYIETRPMYHSKMSQPDTSYHGAGLVDFGVAVQQGVQTQISIQDARNRQLESLNRTYGGLASLPNEIAAMQARTEELNRRTEALKAELPTIQEYYRLQLRELEFQNSPESIALRNAQITAEQERSLQETQRQLKELELSNKWVAEGVEREVARVLEMPYAPGNAIGLLNKIETDYSFYSDPEVKQSILTLREFIKEAMATHERILTSEKNGHATDLAKDVEKEMTRLIEITEPQYRDVAQNLIPSLLERAKSAREFKQRTDVAKTTNPKG